MAWVGAWTGQGGGNLSIRACPSCLRAMGTMDTLDVAIFREAIHPRGNFQWNVRESYRQLADALGVDEETARLRVKRLQEQGILRGWEIVLNPTVLGRVLLRLDLPPLPPARKEALLAQAPHLDGIRWVFDHFEGSVVLALFTDPVDVARTVALVESLAGVAPETWQIPTPAAAVELTPLDWRILRALRRDPRRPYNEVAEELGVSAKTVKRRVERLMEGRACFLSGVVDFAAARGVIPVEIAVPHAPGEDPAPVHALLRSLENRIFERLTPHMSAVSVIAFSMVEVEEIKRRVRQVAGGRERASVLLRRITYDDWLDARIEREAGLRAT